MINCKIQKEEHIKTKGYLDNIKELLTIVLLVISYVMNNSFLLLTVMVLACGLVVFSNHQKAIYYLAFFTSFAEIFVYNGRSLFLLMLVLFILKSIITNQISRNTFLFYLVIFAYTILFSDIQAGFYFTKFIGLILVFVIPLVAYYSDKIDCGVFIRHYILGFVVATIIGFFVENIPSMYQLFGVSFLYTESQKEVTRFFGLAFDSNFYALSNYTIIAYLLFAFEKITPVRGFLILFLLIPGIMTISKSYFLMIVILLIFYIVKNISKVKHLFLFVLFIIAGFLIFSIVSNKLGYNAIELVTSRFISGAGFAENTTGRTEIWKNYIDLFNENGIKVWLFGFGFNANEFIGAAHNTFIEIVYHYGIVGLVLWGAYLAHCLNLFRIKSNTFENKSPIICICFVAGIFFLSAFTYEAFWIGIVISFMTLGRKKKIVNYQ